MKIMDDKSIRSALVATPQPAAGWGDLLRKIEYATRKVSLTDHERIQSIRSLVCAEISKSEVRHEAPAPAERRICEDDGSGEEIFNRPDLVPARPDTAEARLREACRLALEFIESEMKYSQPAHDMGEEPSDKFTYDAVPVAMTLRQALTPGSEGAKLLPCPVCGGEAIHAIEALKRTIIKPDPSEPDRREIVARKLMGFDGHQPWELTEAEQQQYFARADLILAALGGGR